jgi:hypothetical protein
MSGFTSAEAVGMPFESVFKIMDKGFDRPVSNIMEMAVRENRSVGLPYRWG